MDYYIYVTKKCNLKCEYCCEKQEWSKIIDTTDAIEPRYKIQDLINFIINNEKKIEKDEINIILYGGEPLLNQKWIKQFLQKTKQYDFNYILFTNGVTLSIIDKYVLKRISTLFISIDGGKEITDKYRGQGIHKKTLDNLSKIKNEYNGKTIATMTITPYNNLYKSVLSIIDHFDFIFWKLLSSDKIENKKWFTNNYDKSLDLLLNYWIKKLKQGQIKRIIPFLAITTTLLDNAKKENYRCDCGDFLVTVDTDGSCYSCDELTDKKYKIGSISGSITQKKLPHPERCKECEYRYVCGGRCPKEDIIFPKEIAEYHCYLTKLLIKKIIKKIPEIKEIIDKGIIKREDLNFPRTTSEIP